MTKNIMGVILMVIVIGGLSGCFAGKSCGYKEPTPSIQPAPAQPSLPSPTAPAKLPSPTPLPSLPPPPLPTAPAKVQFSVGVTEISGSGLSRTVTALLGNTGTADAHNTWAKIEVFSSGNRIKVNGNDFARVDIGTLAAGSVVTKQVTLSFGLLDAPRLLQNGAQVVLTLTSDEATQTIQYDFTP